MSDYYAKLKNADRMLVDSYVEMVQDNLAEHYKGNTPDDVYMAIIGQLLHNHKIIVTVSGGLVQSVEQIPPGVTVEIRDYDVDNDDHDNIERDEKGEPFWCNQFDNVVESASLDDPDVIAETMAAHNLSDKEWDGMSDAAKIALMHVAANTEGGNA